MAQIFTDSNFQQEVLNEKNKPVLVDFYADWCGPCQMLTPIINELAEEFGDKIKIGKVNVDENSEVAGQYNVRSIPTLLFFKDGSMVAQSVGFMNKESLEEKIKSLI
ncbi:MAG: thioredoxin, thioredoxin 1 [Candidatus Peregrinibacteria bacterium GW2011_GWF2_33_10]|nr:MAG: thioredoxin, thioredoxin 1 [Candidatus Peregrinibacteria bacterium GW2011_GWF2_33_10]OGJ43952.1 MAG: thioredoxin [Candidatus Peregrinibacteria bacterium RIFOXYA12_FULL_33_12]OGJ46033.1 MAG: thioredoxin [Candidatus Peregrinibacteria bacterium RIFOXYA2_FULL_33_21]OGJ51738.1 MAG: thioredoxin [Candidatus Peregrinibacteria bacterium RIFOXYB2_FULL_33_20]